MLDLTQPDDLSRQYLKRLRMVLKTLTDIFHDQHIFTLVFIIIQQPLAQALRLFIIRMAGDGARQRFGAQQLATSPPGARAWSRGTRCRRRIPCRNDSS